MTTVGSAWLAPVRKDPERLRIAHPDGAAFDAWYIPARGNPRPGPLAIQVHGGPHGSHGPTPWLEMLALADAGIHVLYANPRGSAGYGEAFTRSVHGAFGDLDGDDQLRLVDWAVAEGIADPARVGIFGLSYGGFMTNWLLGHAPGRFAAGVSENPLANAISWYGANDLVDWTDERFMGVGRLPEDIDAFLKRSPFMEIHRNEAPLLLLQSEQDLRCPPQDTDIIFAILRSRGRTVEMIRYPNEPHYLVGIGRPDRRVDRLRRTVEWFTAVSVDNPHPQPLSRARARGAVPRDAFPFLGLGGRPLATRVPLPPVIEPQTRLPSAEVRQAMSPSARVPGISDHPGLGKMALDNLGLREFNEAIHRPLPTPAPEEA